MSYKERALEVKKYVLEHHSYRANCLNMVCAENLMSPLARSLLGSDLHHRYSNVHRMPFYFGNRYFERIEEIAEELGKKLFRSNFIELHPPSGGHACNAVVLALTKPGDLVFELDPSGGGYSTAAHLNQAGAVNLRDMNLPLDEEIMNIDLEKATELIERERPALVVLGSTLYLFPHPVKEISKVVESVGGRVVYDGAHVMGLIAGGCFQDPLREGACALMGSTHKTIPGPQAGLIMSNDPEIADSLHKTSDFTLLGLNHPDIISVHAVVFAELLQFGKEYASQIVKNTKAIAKALYDEGLDVLCPELGFSESHMTIVDVKRFGSGHEIGKRLEEANIIVTKTALPRDNTPDLYLGVTSALRIGTPEATRLGMKKQEMEQIAGLITDVVMRRESPEVVAKKVAEIKREFSTVQYTFEPGNGYRFFE